MDQDKLEFPPQHTRNTSSLWSFTYSSQRIEKEADKQEDGSRMNDIPVSPPQSVLALSNIFGYQTVDPDAHTCREGTPGLTKARSCQSEMLGLGFEDTRTQTCVRNVTALKSPELEKCYCS